MSNPGYLYILHGSSTKLFTGWLLFSSSSPSAASSQPTHTPSKIQHRSITLILLFLVTLFQVAVTQDEFGTVDATKTSWPELVGKNGQAAKATIAQATAFTVQIVPDGSMVTMDVRTDRVRIFVDSDGNVIRPPRTEGQQGKPAPVL
jgi:hypothetical protein